MTEINIFIAKKLGYIPKTYWRYCWGESNDDVWFSNKAAAEKALKSIKEQSRQPEIYSEVEPFEYFFEDIDFSESLDLMAEAEKLLTKEEWPLYLNNIVLYGEGGLRFSRETCLVGATAADKAMAFYKIYNHD